MQKEHPIQQLEIQILAEGQAPRNQQPLEKRTQEHIEVHLQVLKVTRQEVVVQEVMVGLEVAGLATEVVGQVEVVDQEVA